MSTISNELVKPGQRVSSKTSFNTGPLVGSPKYIKTSEGLLIVLETESGPKHVKVEGGSMTTGTFTFDASGLSEMSES